MRTLPVPRSLQACSRDPVGASRALRSPMTAMHPPTAPALRRGPRRRSAARPDRSARAGTASAPASPRTLAAIAAGGAAVFAATAVLAKRDDSLRRPRFDRAVRRDGHAPLHALFSRWLPDVDSRAASEHAVSRALGHVGGKLETLIAMSLAGAALGARRGLRPALPVLAAIPVVLGTSELLKPAIQRPRPWTARLMGKKSRSFPSGHTARAVAMFGLGAHVARREGMLPPFAARSLAVALPLAVGASRIHVDRHWATDVIGGLGYGAAAAALCAMWYDAVTA